MPHHRQHPTPRRTPRRTPHSVRSSWISSIYYHRGFLVLFLRDTDTATALLHSGVPSWVPGLLAAGTRKENRRSVGRAYCRLVKGRYSYQRIEGGRVEELRRMVA